MYIFSFLCFGHARWLVKLLWDLSIDCCETYPSKKSPFIEQNLSSSCSMRMAGILKASSGVASWPVSTCLELFFRAWVRRAILAIQSSSRPRKRLVGGGQSPSPPS